jgi:hypothetical protein
MMARIQPATITSQISSPTRRHTAAAFVLYLKQPCMERVRGWLNTELVLQMEIAFDIILLMTPMVTLAAYLLICHQYQKRRTAKLINAMIYRSMARQEFYEEDGSEIRPLR